MNNNILFCTFEAGVLKKLFNALGIVKTINLTFDEKGVSGQTMDSAHVCLISVCIFADKIERYHCDRSITLGLKMDSVKKIMNCGANNDKCSLYVRRSNEDVLYFLFETPEGKITKEFMLKLMEIDEEGLRIPEGVEYPVVIVFDSVVFQKMCKHLINFGDVMEIKTYSGNGVINFSSGGEESNETANFSYEIEENEYVRGTVKTDYTFTYSLPYIENFTKSTPLSSEVILYIKEDVPIYIKYPIGDQAGYIAFHLAPKIDEN